MARRRKEMTARGRVKMLILISGDVRLFKSDRSVVLMQEGAEALEREAKMLFGRYSRQVLCRFHRRSVSLLFESSVAL